MILFVPCLNIKGQLYQSLMRPPWRESVSGFHSPGPMVCVLCFHILNQVAPVGGWCADVSSNGVWYYHWYSWKASCCSWHCYSLTSNRCNGILQAGMLESSPVYDFSEIYINTDTLTTNPHLCTGNTMWEQTNFPTWGQRTGIPMRWRHFQGN